MTTVFNGRKKSFVCPTCDKDPLNSPELQKLLKALRPPKDECQGDIRTFVKSGIRQNALVGMEDLQPDLAPKRHHFPVLAL